MRSRAALLPHPADPFLFKYWLKFFENVWGDEVDKLYIYLNSPIETDVIEYIQNLCKNNPKIRLLYIAEQREHGYCIEQLLDICTEEYVMLIEDDGYIFKKGIVDNCFALLESDICDVVGSPRGSCSEEIMEAARLKFNLNYDGIGDKGPNFWPNFFFSKRKTLLDTDRNFGARAWESGALIEPLNYIVPQKPEPVVGDTFVNTSLQLRAKIPSNRIYEIAQYHGDPNDLTHYEKKTDLFDGKAGWIHIGSLSSGVGGILRDNEGRPLARRLIDNEGPEKLPDYCNTDGERLEWERRCVAWEFFLENAISDKAKLPDFYQLYRDAVDRVIKQYQLDKKKIHRWMEAYRTLGL